MSNGTYVFVRFADRRQLDEATRRVSELGGVARWDAIDGYFQMALRLSHNGEVDIKHIRGLSGLTEVVDCPIAVDDEHDSTLSPDACHSYLLIEAAPQDRESIRRHISDQEQTLFCSATDGPYNLVAVVRGESFGEIDRLVDQAITPMDGILRLKQNRILTSMVS